MEPLPPSNKAPKDGYGPRGWPDCYYTSRVLDSTARYVRFVKKLRSIEEEQRKGALNALKEQKDKQYNDFFIRCDRRSLINNVARRVDLCLASYQEDLKAKKQRLKDLLTSEEEMNIRKFVEQAQAGAEALWQDKKDRLAYLLAKRKKEHEDKYKDVPISKCTHVRPCIVKLHAKEAQTFQLYQMREKEAKKMAERELDKMWYEVAMKESEALAARMELDSIERARRDQECLRHTDEQIALKNAQRERERELLKEESLKRKARFEEAAKKEDEESRLIEQKRLQTARDCAEMLKERQETLALQQAESKLIQDTWDSLSGIGLAEEKKKLELMRKKEMELDICNKRMMKIKQNKEAQAAKEDALLEEETKRLRDVHDQKRCEFAKKFWKTNQEVHAGIREQIKENALARERQAKEDDDMKEYQRQLCKQVEQLVAHKELTEAQGRKLYQNQLLQQIEYNKLLKERQWQEELNERKKSEIASKEYANEIKKILTREFFSEDIHPFMKVMKKGLKMPETCLCSKPNYCAVPILGPKTASKDTPKDAPKGGSGAAPTTKVKASPNK